MSLKPIVTELKTSPTWLEQRTIRKFHQVYFDSRSAGKPWRHTFWLGTRILKCPLDLWIYQEIVHELRPDFIIETGTAYGGSAHYLGTLCDLVGAGQVITIDIEAQPGRPSHPRVEYVLGSSVDRQLVARIKAKIAGARRVLVILDSDHSRDHVLAELKVWGDVVTPGSYCIVEDSNINGHPVDVKFGPGPMEAIDLFLAADTRFQIDAAREKFLLTFNPRGYLKRLT
jgi:cephalosporin hydroxylase